jgi:dTDP-4-dehydrorhamnose reductase
MTHILITGASGLLGLNLALYAASHENVFGTVFSHELKNVPFQIIQADLQDSREIHDCVDEADPEVIINCAAMANLEACEKEPETAELLNIALPIVLAEVAQKRKIKLVQISTDAVFDGQRGNYVEEDQPNPLSVYARTKWESEKAVTIANPDSLIVRVNFYGYSLLGKRSLAEFFLYNLAAGTRVFGFSDVNFCPLLAQDLAPILFGMIKKDLKGIYHVVSPESLSKYDFGVRIAHLFDLNENLVEAVDVSKGGLLARRSPNLSLRIDKLIRDLGQKPPGQDAGLLKFHQLYEEDYPEKLKAFLSSD